MSTLQKVVKVKGDASKRRFRYRQILTNALKKIKRRGGPQDQSLCPHMYERPVEDEIIALYCRVVKKPCYLTIYEMQGFPQCPRYIRRQRRIQLANARRIVHAGIQRILEEADSKRQLQKGAGLSSWTEPIHAIIDHLFSVLSVRDETIAFAHRIVDKVGQKGLFQGHPRPIIAASIAYLCAKQLGDEVPENDIIELVGCSRTSLRRNYRELNTLLAGEKQQKPQSRRRKRNRKMKEEATHTE